MQITIEVTDRLGEQLQQLGDCLPKALDRALQELTSIEITVYQDDRRDRNKDARAVISDRRFLENDIEANKTIESSAIDFDSITRWI
jgi:hypothetical protein